MVDNHLKLKVQHIWGLVQTRRCLDQMACVNTHLQDCRSLIAIEVLPGQTKQCHRILTIHVHYPTRSNNLGPDPEPTLL
jgi:hypothetical protein